MIDTIYEDIRTILLGLKLKEAQEYFDFNNIPDSLVDDSFLINPVALSAGDLLEPSTRIPLFNLKSEFKIKLAMKLPPNNIVTKMKTTNVLIENIIKGILAISCGSNSKDSIIFSDSEYKIENGKLLYEINFDLNYRISNV